MDCIGVYRWFVRCVFGLESNLFSYYLFQTHLLWMWLFKKLFIYIVFGKKNVLCCRLLLREQQNIESKCLIYIFFPNMDYFFTFFVLCFWKPHNKYLFNDNRLYVRCLLLGRSLWIHALFFYVLIVLLVLEHISYCFKKYKLL